jgi:hypothetical protein
MVNELLDRITGILAAATVSIIALSVCHEYGYFLSVGRYFQSLLVPSDYSANAIFYLPFALFIAYTWIDLPLFARPPGQSDKTGKVGCFRSLF